MQIILKAAKTAKISGVVLLAICTHETHLSNVKVQYDGGTPSYGICMVKQETAEFLGYHGKPEGLMDPATNAKYAALYLKYQHERYDGDWCKTVAAFNAGRYNESKIMPGYPRNLKYVNKVRKLLTKSSTENLVCGKTSTEEEYAEDNGPRL